MKKKKIKGEEKPIVKIEENKLSHVAIPIGMFFKETNQSLGKATGFIYEYEEKYFLITNWHNVTGIDANTGKQISSHGGKTGSNGNYS